ncbi:hypothetical protein WA026_018424, partial [Henosepilachna vigintioctopunctata]
MLDDIKIGGYSSTSLHVDIDRYPTCKICGCRIQNVISSPSSAASLIFEVRTEDRTKDGLTSPIPCR